MDNSIKVPRDKLKEGITEQYNEIRPWGQFTVIEATPKYVIKKIIVNPGQELSIQYHNFRSETWTIVFGEGEIFQGGKWHTIKEQHYFISTREQHSIKNTSEKWPLVFIEVQTGHILKESDIVRISDRYGR